jgi:tRNA(Ile)-lysidine synthase
MPAQKSTAVSATEARALFSGLHACPVLVLAVSGGPDSTALMLLAARWRDALKTKPTLIAVTIDHGLRKEAKHEAVTVAHLARKLKIAHRTLRWAGRKPSSGLQNAARIARYQLLGAAARKAGAAHILTAHTLDDQAETVLIRMSRGSGLTGLGAMTRMAVLPVDEERTITLVRPLLDVSKARLIATLRAAKIGYAEDPSNRDPKFTRARLRGLMSALADEGLDAGRLAQLARRLRRAESAIEAAVDRAAALVIDMPRPHAVALEARRFAELPAEIALRLLGRLVAQVGDEGPVELGKLEALKSALDAAQNTGDGPFRRSLAGAIVTLAGPQMIVERAPARRRNLLTKHRPGRARRAKKR